MLQNFAPSPATSTAHQPPTPAPAPTDPERDRVRILVIGTPQGIDAICHSLHVKGFARLDEWSPLLPHNAGRFCRILTRVVVI